MQIHGLSIQQILGTVVMSAIEMLAKRKRKKPLVLYSIK